ncbi:hypothetical protein [Streptomyces sp. NPDC002922]|uniref:hypothetical protein n=1 Tax=Streptomyces sp. NPDC002922 TaxID=3154439 RepID=UPI0033B1864D
MTENSGGADAERLRLTEYAKAGPEDLLIEITAHKQGLDEATLHLLPTLWFRHTWSWAGGTAVPGLRRTDGAIRTDHEELGPRWLYFAGGPQTLFTENDTNNERIFGSPNATPSTRRRPGAWCPRDQRVR